MASAEKSESAKGPKKQAVSVQPLDLRIAIFEMVGTSPLVVNKFSQKALDQMKAKQEAGEKAKIDPFVGRWRRR